MHSNRRAALTQKALNAPKIDPGKAAYIARRDREDAAIVDSFLRQITLVTLDDAAALKAMVNA